MDTPVLANKQKLIHQLCADTGCCLEDLPSVMADRDTRQDIKSKESVLSACYDDDNDINSIVP